MSRSACVAVVRRTISSPIVYAEIETRNGPALPVRRHVATVPLAACLAARLVVLNRFLSACVIGIVLAGIAGSCRREPSPSSSTGASQPVEPAGPTPGPDNRRQSDAPASPDILIIIIDTLRADHLGCYGYFRDTSPTINALAQESVVFERCMAPVALTLPTHMSIFTGVYPYEHGFLSNIAKLGGLWIPSPALKTFATVLSENGYTTAGFVSAAPVKKITGMAAGFSVWSEPSVKKVTGEDTTRRVLKWLDAGVPQPFMLWVHYFDTHSPYEPPHPYDTMYQTDDALEAYMAKRRISDTAPKRYRKPRGEEGVRIKDSRQDINHYDGELRHVDDQINRVFDALRRKGVWDRLAIVVTSDHGEGLGQHGRVEHAHIWGEQLHVPLLMRVPGRAHARIAEPLSSVDVLPTFLAMVPGVPADEFLSQCAGRAVLAGAGTSSPIYAQMPRSTNTGKVPSWSITVDGWRLIRDSEGNERLYDLRADPYELNDVADDYPDKTGGLRKRLEQIVTAQKQRGQQNQAGRIEKMDSQHYDALKVLGYVGDEDE